MADITRDTVKDVRKVFKITYGFAVSRLFSIKRYVYVIGLFVLAAIYTINHHVEFHAYLFIPFAMVSVTALVACINYNAFRELLMVRILLWFVIVCMVACIVFLFKKQHDPLSIVLFMFLGLDLLVSAIRRIIELKSLIQQVKEYNDGK